jgi:hypothetical protein
MAAALMAALVGPGIWSSPARAAADETVAYYTVASASEDLNQVAERLLGSPARSTEIFNLNVGRRQPDGGALSDPGDLRAGWRLALPWDAAGPGVRQGTLSGDKAARTAPMPDVVTSPAPGSAAPVAARNAPDPPLSSRAARIVLVLVVLAGLGLSALLVFRFRQAMRLAAIDGADDLDRA